MAHIVIVSDNSNLVRVGAVLRTSNLVVFSSIGIKASGSHTYPRTCDRHTSDHYVRTPPILPSGSHTSCLHADAPPDLRTKGPGAGWSLRDHANTHQCAAGRVLLIPYSRVREARTVGVARE